MTAFYIISGVIVFLILVFLFLIFPAVRKHPDRKLLNGMYIAHRGIHKNDANLPENSVKSFKLAVAKDFAIENDIHLTSDGEIVVFHDDDLRRMCGENKVIENMTLEELKKYTLGSSEEHIPTLKECLDIINGKVPLLIEFKCKSVVSCKELCAAANEILKDYKGKYFVQSFYPMVLRWYKKNRPDICRGQLASSFKKDKFYKRMLGNMLFNFIARPDFVSYDFNFKNAFMRRFVTKLGAFPVGWTFLSESDVNNCKKDFNAYIFEGFVPEER